MENVSRFDDKLEEEKKKRKTVSTMDFYGTKVDPYKSQQSPQITQFVNDITGYKPYDYTSYDPNKDAAFTSFRDNAIKQGNKAYSSNLAASAVPGVADSSIGRKVAESARSQYTDQIQNAIPTFAEKARQDYDALFNRKVQTLGILRDVDNVDYGRYIDDRNRTDSLSQQYTQDTGRVPVDTSLIPMDSYLRMGIPDYSAEINKRKAANANDPMIPVLTALRMEKIMNDPELFQKYGQTMEMPVGQKTQDRMVTEQDQADKAEMSAFDKALKQKNLDVTTWEFDKIKKDAEKETSDESAFDTNYGNMMASEDPYQWLEANKSTVGYDDYSTLSGLVQPPEDSAFDQAYQSMMSAKDPYSWLQNNKAGVGYDNFVKLSKVVDEPEDNSNQDEFNSMYEQMMNSGSPADWLETNKAAIGYDNYTKLAKLVSSPTASGGTFTAQDYFKRINELMQPDKDGNVNFTEDQAIDMLVQSPLGSSDKLEVAQLLGIYDQVLKYYEKLRTDEAEAVRMKNR